MTVQNLAHDKARVSRYSGEFLGVIGGFAVSGSNGSMIANGSSADFIVSGTVVNAGSYGSGISCGMTISHGTTISTPGGVYQIVEVGMSIPSGSFGYDPDLVSSLLRADLEKPEAVFDNVIDMMDWLQRD
jgi:hypothetical protein